MSDEQITTLMGRVSYHAGVCLELDEITVANASETIADLGTLVTELRALRELTQWHPIKTAPKGRDVLVRGTGPVKILLQNGNGLWGSDYFWGWKPTEWMEVPK